MHVLRRGIVVSGRRNEPHDPLHHCPGKSPRPQWLHPARRLLTFLRTRSSRLGAQLLRRRKTTMIDGVLNIGSLPALERTLQFTGARHRLILHNIANFDTPNYQPQDVDPRSFQAALAEAVDDRRGAGRTVGDLHVKDTRQIAFQPGATHLHPRTPSSNILFHDRNNRDLERTMQSLAENAMAFRAAADIYRSRMGLVKEAIRERVA